MSVRKIRWKENRGHETRIVIMSDDNDQTAKQLATTFNEHRLLTEKMTIGVFQNETNNVTVTVFTDPKASAEN